VADTIKKRQPLARWPLCLELEIRAIKLMWFFIERALPMKVKAIPRFALFSVVLFNFSPSLHGERNGSPHGLYRVTPLLRTIGGLLR